MRGQRGRDAKRIPKGQCGMADSMKKSICCGNSRVAWSDSDSVSGGVPRRVCVCVSEGVCVCVCVCVCV